MAGMPSGGGPSGGHLAQVDERLGQGGIIPVAQRLGHVLPRGPLDLGQAHRGAIIGSPRPAAPHATPVRSRASELQSGYRHQRPIRRTRRHRISSATDEDPNYAETLASLYDQFTQLSTGASVGGRRRPFFGALRQSESVGSGTRGTSEPCTRIGPSGCGRGRRLRQDGRVGR